MSVAYPWISDNSDRERHSIEKQTRFFTAASCVISAVGFLVGQPVWAALVAIAILGVASRERLFATARSVSSRRKDDQIAVLALAELIHYSEAFQQIANTVNDDTLHRVVQKLKQATPGRNLPSLPEARLFEDSNRYWVNHFRGQRQDAAGMRESLLELFGLVNSFNSYCVFPVFAYEADRMRKELSAAEISQLNEFHRKFCGFTDSFNGFLRRLAASRPSFSSLNHAVYPPPAL